MKMIPTEYGRMNHYRNVRKVASSEDSENMARCSTVERLFVGGRL